MKPQATRETVIKDLIRSGLWSNDKVTRCSTVGIRGYYLNSMGRVRTNDRGIYDDAIFVISPHTFASFNFNTDPSSYRRGIASLVAPQRVTYRPGYHGYGKRSGHPAFRQASPVIVRRDGGSGNGIQLSDGLFTDKTGKKFWINLHKGGRRSTSSNGCQTVPSDQWAAFYELVRSEMRKFNQIEFNYYLIETST